MNRSRGRGLAVALLVLAGGNAGAGNGLAAQDTFLTRCGAAVHDEEGTGWVSVPQGQIFCPLAADPLAEHSHVSYRRGDFAIRSDAAPGEQSNIAGVGLGGSFPLFRFAARRQGNGIQVDIAAAVFGQFNLDTHRLELITTDYLVGVPVTMRYAGFSTRLRVYHLNSHLGDEAVLSGQPGRTDMSFESLEALVSQELGLLRVYGGGEAFIRREPAELANRLVHAGGELRPVLFGGGRLLLAFDYKLVDDGSWSYGWNARAGLELARVPKPGHPPQVLTVVFDWYEGAAPYGQFYSDDIRYFGVGVHLSG